MRLSVVIPVYNERSSLPRVLTLVGQVLPAVPKELIVVDDGSRDGTREWLQAHIAAAGAEFGALELHEPDRIEFVAPAAGAPRHAIRVLYHERNRGKGAALRTGFAVASGDAVVVQDADLEYDPQDWALMWPLIADRKVADVVYGSRFSSQPHRSLFFHHYLANRLLSLLFNVLFNQTLTDVEVCYKMFTRPVLDSLRLRSNDFGIEIEISAQIARRRSWRIYEVGIQYFGRTYDQGKKINWKDGVKALWYLLRYRLG